MQCNNFSLRPLATTLSIPVIPWVLKIALISYSLKSTFKNVYLQMPIFISRKMYNNLSITEETLEPLGPPSISLLPRGNLWYQLGALPFSYFSIYIFQCAPSEQYFSNYGWVLNQFNEPGPAFAKWKGMARNKTG